MGGRSWGGGIGVFHLRNDFVGGGDRGDEKTIEVGKGEFIFNR